MKHYLKTLTEYFNAVESGIKTFEVRRNDRGFKVGDTLILQDWDGWERTGRELIKKVTYVLDDSQYCKDGYVVLGIK
jgi:ASC-1-like (ASCH) protein